MASVWERTMVVHASNWALLTRQLDPATGQQSRQGEEIDMQPSGCIK
jgi:hypothetical protein